jgi:hypothetical protein
LFIERFPTFFSGHGAIWGRLGAVFGAEEIGKAGVEIPCPASGHIGKSVQGRYRASLHAKRFKLRENVLKGEMEGNRRNDIIDPLIR